MEGFVRGFGRLVDIALLLPTAGGWLARGGDPAALSTHALLGLVGVLMVLLFHSLPYFWLIGATGALRESVGDDPERRESLLVPALAAKSALFLPTGAVILLALATPFLGILRTSGDLPALVHGGVGILLFVVHLRVRHRAADAISQVRSALAAVA